MRHPDNAQVASGNAKHLTILGGLTVQTHRSNVFGSAISKSNTAFKQLCSIIGPWERTTVSSHWPPVPSDKTIAMELYKLAACTKYRFLVDTFGVTV